MEILTKNLRVGYGKTTVATNIALEIRTGKIVALVGPNGAGKSTILKTVAGLLEPLDGAVYFDGVDAKTLDGAERSKRLAVMTTSRTDAEFATAFDAASVGRFRFTGALGILSEKDKRAVDDALELVGAKELRDLEFAKLSDGQKQRVLLARALAQEPRVLILDEPTSFLDVGYKIGFLTTLKRLAKEKGIGALISMHELELVKNVADLVACVSKNGQIERLGPPDRVLTNDCVETLFNIPKGELAKTYGEGVFPRARIADSVNAKNSNAKTRFIMIQGSMSNVGKSLVAAGLCRVFAQDGYRVAPFKSQNMALNSFVTRDGLEMGRAQVMQAEAAGVEPDVAMNPILLKPTTDVGSQVIVNGRVIGNMPAREYFEYKKRLAPEILAAVDKLRERADIIVIEGAGSPAEINLKENDIVNMGMAALVDAPVLLVGDIDRGGVFAQLLGTLELLEPDERVRVKGLIVNKFRGDKSILEPGVAQLERLSGVPVVGVVPYARLMLDDEDSLTERFARRSDALIEIGVVRFPRIANFSDFDVFEQFADVAVKYVGTPRELETLDALILPGSKSVVADLKWLKESGLEPAVKKFAADGRPVIGICGGYQALGIETSDPDGVEGGGRADGLALLPVVTVLKTRKTRRQTSGAFVAPTGIFSNLLGIPYAGYEIHMGETTPINDSVRPFTSAGSGFCWGNVYGTYVHGVFDDRRVATGILYALAKKKGIALDLQNAMNCDTLKQREFNKLAQIVRENMDVDAIYRAMGAKNG